MTNGQALVALGKGYGIRPNNWRQEVYLYMDENGIIRDSEYNREDDWNKWCYLINKSPDINWELVMEDGIPASNCKIYFNENTYGVQNA